MFCNSLLSDHFDVYNFGKYQFLVTLIGIGAILRLDGFNIYIQKELKNDNIYILKNLISRVLPIIASIILIIIFLVNFFEFQDKLLFSCALIIIFLSLFDRINIILEIEEKFKKIRYIDLIHKFSFLLITSVTIYYQLDLDQFFKLFILVNSLFFLFKLILLYQLFYKYKMKNNSNTTLVLKESYFRSISISLAIITGWIEKLILGLLNPISLAIFSIGQLIPKILKDNIKVLMKPTLYKIANDTTENNYKLIKKDYLIYIAFGFISFLLLNIIIEPFINIFFEKYTNSIIITRILSVQLILIFLVNILSYQILFSNKTKSVNKIENSTNILRIISGIILIYYFGLNGAVLSLVISEMLRQFYYISTYLKINNKW